MREKRSSIKISIFIKIFMLLVIIMGCFSGISIIISQISYNHIKREITKFENSKLTYFLNDFESEIARITTFQKEYFFDSDLLFLSKIEEGKSQYQKVEAIKKIYEKLVVIKESSKYIETIDVHIPLMKRTITSETITKSLNLQESTELIQNDSYGENPIIKYENDYYLVFPYYVGNKNENTILYLITVKLSKDYIIENLKRSAFYPNSNIVLYNTEQKWCVSTFNDEKFADYTLMFEQYDDTSGGPHEIRGEQEGYVFFVSYSEYLNMKSFYIVQENTIFSSLEKYKNYLLIIISSMILLLIVFAYWMYHTFNKPLNKLVHAFENIEAEKFDIKINHKSNDEFEFVFKSFNAMSQKIRHLIENEYKHNIMLKDALLKQYQYKMNPHMLYNSLYFIYRMAKLQENDDVAEFSLVIAEYYKFINKHAAGEVALVDEIAHCQNYVEIQSKRFGNRIRAEINYNQAEIKGIEVPSLIVQPILENAYKYAFEEIAHQGMIQVSITKQGNILYIVVEDNGKGMDEQLVSQINRRLSSNNVNEDLGSMVNVYKRLKIKYGEESGLSFENSKNGGLKVAIKIVCDDCESKLGTK